MNFLQSRILQKVKNVQHAFFFPDELDRIDNLSFKNGERETVLAARQRACTFLNLQSEHLTQVYQEHGTTLWRIEANHRGAGALTGEGQVGVGDGMMTCIAGIPLAILVADCLPIFFADADGTAVGMVHAGWRGTLDGIASKFVLRWMAEFQLAIKNLLVWIGPGISACCFRVGEEVWDRFQTDWGEYQDIFNDKERHIDLKRLNQYQLLSAGIPESQLEISPECTCCNRRFFSYRRDGAGRGHNMAVIQLNHE